jgi:hypothetical protein
VIEKIANLINRSGVISSAMRIICQKGHLGTDYWRYLIGALERPHYAHLLVHSAQLAKRFGISEISVVEFGVGGGGGLKIFEDYSRWVEKRWGVRFKFFGFDSGKGMPIARSLYDLPYMWTIGQFDMRNSTAIEKLKKSEVIIGPISETINQINSKSEIPPIGAIAFDVDYYSSTLDALQIFNLDPDLFLPRIPLYFDDCIGTEIEMHIDWIGERRAIMEYNESQEKVKIGQAYNLSTSSTSMRWTKKIWYAHLFKNSLYTKNVSDII